MIFPMSGTTVFVLFILSCPPAEAQYPGPDNPLSGKRSDGFVQWNERPYHADHHRWSILVPAVMIGYGLVGLKSDPAQDLNEYVKEEIWTEDPHQPKHIDNYLQFAPAAAVYGLRLGGIKGENNLLDCSLIYLLSNIIMNSAVSGIKQIAHEERPDGSDHLSFPSGHTAEAFASAAFLSHEYRNRSAWYGVAGYGVAAGVGFLRIYNDKHWLSDIVAGAGFGIASTRLAYWLYPKIKHKFFKNSDAHTILVP